MPNPRSNFDPLIAWRWGDQVYFGDQVMALDDFRRRFSNVALCELSDTQDVWGILAAGPELIGG